MDIDRTKHVEKEFQFNSLFCDKARNDTVFIRRFRNHTLQGVRYIRISDYVIDNTFGSLNVLNKDIVFKDINGATTTFNIGNVGDFVDIRGWSSDNNFKSVSLTNGDEIRITYDTDDKAVKIFNNTNTNNFEILMNENYALSKLLGLEPINHTGSNSYTGSFYPSNQPDRIAIECNIVREIEDTFYNDEGIRNLSTVYITGGYGSSLMRDFMDVEEYKITKHTERDSFYEIRFSLIDEFGQRIKTRGNFSLKFVLGFDAHIDTTPFR